MSFSGAIITGIITRLEAQKRNNKRVNVYIDDEFALSLTLDEAVKLRKGQQLSEAEIAQLQGEDAVQKAIARAANLLATRPRSRAEVRRNLLQKEIPPAVIDAALDRLTEQGYLDDHAFAAFWIRERSQFKPLSEKALRYELRQKGVARTIIDELLDDQNDEDAAYRAAQIYLRRLRGLDQRAFKQKMAAFLARRGFSASDSRRAIQRCIEELAESGAFAAGESEFESEDV